MTKHLTIFWQVSETFSSQHPGEGDFTRNRPPGVPHTAWYPAPGEDGVWQPFGVGTMPFHKDESCTSVLWKRKLVQGTPE